MESRIARSAGQVVVAGGDGARRSTAALQAPPPQPVDQPGPSPRQLIRGLGAVVRSPRDVGMPRGWIRRCCPPYPLGVAASCTVGPRADQGRAQRPTPRRGLALGRAGGGCRTLDRPSACAVRAGHMRAHNRLNIKRSKDECLQ